MSFIDQSGRSLVTCESGDDHLHPFREVIHGIFEVIGDRRIHLHGCLDDCIILVPAHDIRESEGICMDGEFLIRSIEELLSKYRRQIVDGLPLIIVECTDTYHSCEFDIIGEISDLFPSCDDDVLITELHTLTHEESILFSILLIRLIYPCLDAISRYPRELFMDNPTESIDFTSCDEVDPRIHPSEKCILRFRIDLISIELQTWNRERHASCDIAPRADDTPRFIRRICDERDTDSSDLCDTTLFLGSGDTDP